jgi:hypothetical protein
MVSGFRSGRAIRKLALPALSIKEHLGISVCEDAPRGRSNS